MKEYPGKIFLTPFSFRQTTQTIVGQVNEFCLFKFPHYVACRRLSLLTNQIAAFVSERGVFKNQQLGCRLTFPRFIPLRDEPELAQLVAGNNDMLFFQLFWYCLGSGLGTIGDFSSEEELLHDPRWKMVSTFNLLAWGSGDYVLTQ